MFNRVYSGLQEQVYDKTIWNARMDEATDTELNLHNGCFEHVMYEITFRQLRTDSYTVQAWSVQGFDNTTAWTGLSGTSGLGAV